MEEVDFCGANQIQALKISKTISLSRRSKLEAFLTMRKKLRLIKKGTERRAATL